MLNINELLEGFIKFNIINFKENYFIVYNVFIIYVYN